MWPDSHAPHLTWPLAVLVALAVDRLFGEPPARWHPVVGMGRYLAFMGRRIAPTGNSQQFRSFVLGAVAWCLGAALVVGVSLGLWWWTAQWAWWLQALALGLLLKPLLAWRMLHSEVQAVEGALADSLAAGRERLSWLVSRDVSALDASQVRESAIEIAGREPERFGGRTAVLVRALPGFPVLRSTDSPTPPTPCGATGANAMAASGHGPASGRRGPTMCFPGCPRASPAHCSV